ncbi:MAG TPA: hypothetical protein VK452_03485 [Dissulfurispiraceae bacterium]|nr:hypothetical protein [Dissulfurispiraceae bacterium]
MKELRLAFLDKILSSYAHEVRNYLAIIKETNGLMKDVLQVSKSKSIDSKQFLGYIGSVEDQIARAADITDYLHRFAHRMDCGRIQTSVNEIAEELLALMARLAYRKRIALEKNLRGGIPPTSVDPILLHYLLFSLIDAKMSCFDRNSKICVSTSLSGGCACITLLSKGEPVKEAPAPVCSDEEIRQLASEIGAEISSSGEETTIKLPAAV